VSGDLVSSPPKSGPSKRARLIVRLTRARLRPTARLRLAALLTSLFLIAGMALLALSYALVRDSLTPGPGPVSGVVSVSKPPSPPGLVPPLSAPDASGKPGPGGAPGGASLQVTSGGPLGLGTKVDLKRLQQQLASRTLHNLLVQYLLILGALAMLAAAGGWLLAGRVLRPIKRMTKTARAVSQENLSERISHDGPEDELKELADTFDEMLARLQDAFERQRAFIANASHELRTPLAIIRTEADVALAATQPDPEELLASMRAVRAATARSDRLIGGLLTLARVERSHRPTTAVELGELAADALRDAEPERAARGLGVTAELGPAVVRGDRRLLETLLRNLLDNAISYNRPHGELSLLTRHDPHAGRCTLRVANSGETISPRRLASLTQPFQRLAREQPAGGVGLGLSIVQAIVTAHHGNLTLEANDGGGLCVLVELPDARGLDGRAVAPARRWERPREPVPDRLAVSA
jgi:signal transduction histidine kinase